MQVLALCVRAGFICFSGAFVLPVGDELLSLTPNVSHASLGGRERLLANSASSRRQFW